MLECNRNPLSCHNLQRMCAQKLRVNDKLHAVLERSVVDPLASYWRNTLEQHFHATERFSADSDDDSVWEQVGLVLVFLPQLM